MAAADLPTHDELAAHAERCGVPDHMVEGLVHFVLTGRPVGSFLTAILENDYRTACAHADDKNAVALVAYARFLYNHAPMSCWGSPENFKHWRDVGGLHGYFEKADKARAEAAAAAKEKV